MSTPSDAVPADQLEALRRERDEAVARHAALRNRKAVRAALAAARLVGRLRPATTTPSTSVESLPTEPTQSVAASDAAPAPGPADDEVAHVWELGHFYSPVPDTRVLSREPTRSRVWPGHGREMPGVDWRPQTQLALLAELGEQDPLEGWHTQNPNFSYLDSWVLQAMLRHVRPQRVIEVGCGWSTLVTAWVNRETRRGEMDVTCIEPYPLDFLTDGPIEGLSRLEAVPIQDVPPSRFEVLEAGDVLFIDTAHVVKTGGDVTYLFHEIVPRLAPGVVVHVHDIFLPYDYPQDWVLGGRGWNEQYLVQSFLAFNDAFEVLLGNAWLWFDQRAALEQHVHGFPGPRSDGGGSLWMRSTERIARRS